jgi:hypothetical protein
MLMALLLLTLTLTVLPTRTFPTARPTRRAATLITTRATRATTLLFISLRLSLHIPFLFWFLIPVVLSQVRIHFIVLVNFFFMYVSVPMLWAMAIMITMAQKGLGLGQQQQDQEIDCKEELIFDKDPDDDEQKKG